jgi:hypothetical protein
VFDAHGADDGRDAARLRDFAGLFYAERRAERIDQVLRTSGSQLGVPAPLGAPDQYGDVSGGLDVGDLTEVRWGATVPGHLDLLVSVANLTEADRLGVLVLVDRQVGGGSQVGLGTGLTTERFDTAVLLTSGGATGRDLVTGTDLDLAGAEVAVGADGWDNHVEARLPEALLTGNGPDGPTFDAAVVTVRREADGTVTPLNAAYRHADLQRPAAGTRPRPRDRRPVLVGPHRRHRPPLGPHRTDGAPRSRVPRAGLPLRRGHLGRARP